MKRQFINYAHRGASAYAPENTMMAFYLGLYMGANGIETDVHLTNDGVAVLFHDDTLERVTGNVGSISDYSLEQLNHILVKNGELTDRIPTLTDFLDHFAFRDLIFAVELKQLGTAKVVADILRSYDIREKVVVTSFKLEELRALQAYAPEFETGLLKKEFSEELVQEMLQLGITELCPHAAYISKDKVDQYRDMGFRVRAWGVGTPDLMQQAYEAGVDGMTVNFPDVLHRYIGGEDQ